MTESRKRKRHFGQCAVRQSAGGGGEAAQSRPGPVRRDQFFRRRDGQDDLAPDTATGVSVTDLRGPEGVVFARTFWHSVVLTLALGVLVAIQQFVVPRIIPQ